MRKQKGFLLVTVLLVLLVVSAIGLALYARTTQDIGFVQHEILNMQAEEVARSGIAYCRAYGVPPLVNGKPQVLKLFPEKDYAVEISREVDAFRFTGTIRSGNRILAQNSLTTPTWDLNDIRKAP